MAHWRPDAANQSVRRVQQLHARAGFLGCIVAAQCTVPPVAPQSVVLLDGGDEAYPRMLLTIEHAQRSVLLHVYAFSAHGVGVRFVEALSRAVRRGVEVDIVIDGWGSVWGGRSVARVLRDAGCSVRIYNRLWSLLAGRFGRNHRKVLLVDDAVAFIGGINIGDENVRDGARLAWADLALEIRGPQCARLGAMIRDLPHRTGDGSLGIYLSGIGGGFRLRRRYLKAFASARHHIDVAHGYFLPDRGVVRALTAAARRGVQVRLLLAGRSDVPFARAATRSLYRQLLAAGVGIREWNDSVLHAKVATVDARRLLIGSFNLDPFSLADLEVLVEVTDPHIVQQVDAWIQAHLTGSREITFVEASTRLQRWVFEPLGRFVARAVDAMGRIIGARQRSRGRLAHNLLCGNEHSKRREQ